MGGKEYCWCVGDKLEEEVDVIFSNEEVDEIFCNKSLSETSHMLPSLASGVLSNGGCNGLRGGGPYVFLKVTFRFTEASRTFILLGF